MAIVTGGGRGLGRAIALELARRGANVVIASRNAPELDAVVLEIRRAGGRALAQTADIADARQVQELVLATEQWVGPATIVVNNAGVGEPIGMLADSDPALWLRSLAINVGGAYLVTRAALPGMLSRGYGRILNVTSMSATTPTALRTAYTTSKAALLMLTRSLALELEGTGVAACALDPGPVDTPNRIRVLSALGPGGVGALRGRAPSEVAPVVAYLASSAASPNGGVYSLPDAALERAAASG